MASLYSLQGIQSDGDQSSHPVQTYVSRSEGTYRCCLSIQMHKVRESLFSLSSNVPRAQCSTYYKIPPTRKLLEELWVVYVTNRRGRLSHSGARFFFFFFKWFRYPITNFSERLCRKWGEISSKRGKLFHNINIKTLSYYKSQTKHVFLLRIFCYSAEGTKGHSKWQNVNLHSVDTKWQYKYLLVLKLKS